MAFRFPLFPQRESSRVAWAGERPALEQFLLLSMLVHVFLVIAFGDTVGARSENGSRLLGGFTARLVGQSKPAQTPAPSPSPAPRERERSRTTPSAPVSTPSEVPPAMVQPSTAPELSETIALPVVTPTLDKPVAPDLVPLIAKEVAMPSTSFVIPPVAIVPQPTPTPPAPAKVEVTRIAPRPAPDAARAPTAARELAPEFVAPLAVTPAPPLVPINPSLTARELAPAIEVKPEPAVPVALPPTIAPIRASAEPAPRARELVPYVEPIAPEIPAALPSPAPTSTPAQPADRAQREFTPYVEPIREAAPAAAATPTPTAAPAQSPATASVLPRTTPAGPTPGTTNTPGTPQGNAAAKSDEALFGPRIEDGPGKGTLGPAPKIDLDAVRQRARDIGANESREGTGPKTLFKFPTAPPPVAKRREQEIFDKALKRPDCKDAYAEMGLAAVVPLVRDAITEKGCKW